MDQTQLEAFVKNAVANMEGASANPYDWSISTGNSQLSFGAMQLDVGSKNAIAVNAFTQIMNTQVGVNGLTQQDINTIIDTAKTDARSLSPSQLGDISAALAANTVLVDQADAQQLGVVMGYVNSAFAAAASNPNGPGELNPNAPDPQFVAALAEWGNRTGGLRQTNDFLSTASNVSQSVWEGDFLSITKQFLTSNETISGWDVRVSAAANSSLNAIGAIT